MPSNVVQPTLDREPVRDRVFDGHYNMTDIPSRRTSTKGLRIYIDQKHFIEQKYGQNCSALIRILLDKFIADPSAQAEFASFLESQKKFKEEVEQLYDARFLGKTQLEPEERG